MKAVRKSIGFQLLFIGTVISVACGSEHPVEVESSTGQQSSLAPLVYVGFEDNHWAGKTDKEWWLHDTWNGINFRLPVEGVPGTYTAWHSPTMANEGKKGLGIRLYDVTLCEDTKQRVEFELSSWRYFTQHLEESRYYGVALYVHPQSDDIVKETVFLQAWQKHDLAEPRYPPFQLSFVPGSDYRWSVTMATGDPAPGAQTRIFTSQRGLQKGRWYEFIVWFKPSVRESGAVRVWLNGSEQVAQTHRRNFGYRPRSTFPSVRDDFAVRFGAYRGRDGSCNRLGDTILIFDQAKFGTSYQAVDP